MSTAEDESGTVKIQATRNALTLTQDLDGNLILHCPQNVSEHDQSFEVTMTATTEVADDDINEESVTQIQILQNEQLADLSPGGNDEVSTVSRAWFTSKEDKDSLTNKGHRWKQGMWSKEEIAILMSNIDRYLKAHGIKDATEIIFEMSKDERKDFYRTIAWGLNRPLFAVYRRVLRMYDDRNHVGNYPKHVSVRKKEETGSRLKSKRYVKHTSIAETEADVLTWRRHKEVKNQWHKEGDKRTSQSAPVNTSASVRQIYEEINPVINARYTHTEIERLRELRVKHGNDWATIGAALGRSASSVKDRCRLMKETCKTGKWTDEEERRLTDVVHELTGTEAGDIVTQGVSWASVAERVGTRSEKQCRSKWLNYLNWKQSGGTQWTKEDEINLILRITELGVLDENDINWDILAEGWSSVRSPQWLRSKWWTVKRQIANHKDVSFPVLIKGLRQLHENQATLLGTQELENKADIQSQSSNSSVQHVQIRVAHLEDSPGLTQSSLAALQIPVQITHLSSSDSSSPSADPETLSGGTLQTYEILPSFFLQPSGTTGTFILQTGSSQSLPLALTSSPGVTLTSNASSASPEQIIVHALSPEHLLNTSDNVTVHCHTPGIIIRTLASDEISAPLCQTEVSIDSDLQQNDLQNSPSSLDTDSLPQEIQHTDITLSHDSLYCTEQSLKMRVRSNTKLLHHPEASDEGISSAHIKSDSCHIDLAKSFVKEDISPSALEEQADQPAVEGTVLIVPSCHGYVQTGDIDGESVLPLTTFADPILQHHRDRSCHIDSLIDGPDSDDLKETEDL